MSPRSPYLKLALFVVVLVGAVLGARAAGLGRYTDLETLASAVRQARDVPGAPFLFVATYAIVATFGLPALPLTLAGGAIFGVGGGTLLNWLGATLGALGGYLLARSLGRDAVSRLLGRYASKLDELATAHGFGAILRLRLIPILPFNVINFASGLAGVPVRPYLAGTALGIIPGTAVYTYFADSLLGGAEGARQQALVRVAIAGGLLVLLSFLPALARRLGWIAPATVALLVTLAAPAAGQDVRRFDHGAFDALLRRHVTGGMVDYDAFARAPEFARYLAALAAFDPAALARDEQLAFWMNAYNAYTIRLINKHGERESIRNINKSLGFVKAYGPWKEKLAVVGGRKYGLDEIEQDIVRPRFKEPRIHFALVCAAMGCPPLRSEAYTGARLDAQLDDQGRTFVLRSPTKNRVDVASRTVHLSPIFVSFRDYIDDFGGSHASVGRFLAEYLPDGPERRLLASGDFKVIETHYDWTLNSQAKARALGQQAARKN